MGPVIKNCPYCDEPLLLAWDADYDDPRTAPVIGLRCRLCDYDEELTADVEQHLADAPRLFE